MKVHLQKIENFNELYKIDSDIFVKKKDYYYVGIISHVKKTLLHKHPYFVINYFFASYDQDFNQIRLKIFEHNFKELNSKYEFFKFSKWSEK